MDEIRDTDETGAPAPKVARRSLLTATSFAALSVGLSTSAFGQTAANETGLIPQPTEPSEQAFMHRAFEMRQSAIDKGDQAYGAVIVRDGKIVGQSYSRVILDQDPTAHAEMAAIRDAARRTNSRDLSGAVMYSSSRPCPMCEAAAFWAGIAEMVYGREMKRAGFPVLCR